MKKEPAKAILLLGLYFFIVSLNPAFAQNRMLDSLWTDYLRSHASALQWQQQFSPKPQWDKATLVKDLDGRAAWEVPVEVQAKLGIRFQILKVDTFKFPDPGLISERLIIGEVIHLICVPDSNKVEFYLVSFEHFGANTQKERSAGSSLSFNSLEDFRQYTIIVHDFDGILRYGFGIASNGIAMLLHQNLEGLVQLEKDYPLNQETEDTKIYHADMNIISGFYITAPEGLITSSIIPEYPIHGKMMFGGYELPDKPGKKIFPRH